MSVKPHELTNRAVEAARAPRRAPEGEAGPGERLAALEARIEAARQLRPPRGVADGSAWGMGRDAVLRLLDGL